jgi:hypothetical protein
LALKLSRLAGLLKQAGDTEASDRYEAEARELRRYWERKLAGGDQIGGTRLLARFPGRMVAQR